MGEFTLGNVFRIVGEERRPKNRDIEHALVIGDDEVGGVRFDPGRTLDQQPHSADPKREDETALHRPGDDLLGALAKEPGNPLQRIKQDQSSPEGEEEGNGQQPAHEPSSHGG